jgi:hypothetical protein
VRVASTRSSPVRARTFTATCRCPSRTWRWATRSRCRSSAVRPSCACRRNAAQRGAPHPW